MKTRSEIVSPTLGGQTCPSKTTRRTCNTDSCDVDCTLTDWSGWGTCSKACKATVHAEPGRMYRKRGIQTPVKGMGKCPMPHSKRRLESLSCNAHTCPENLKCEASMDLLVLLDGSGSLVAKEAFDAQVNVAKLLVENSTLDAPGDDVKAKFVRLGFMVYSDGVQVLAPVTGKKDDLTKALTAATWPAKGSDVDQGLLEANTAAKYFPHGSRLSTVLLFTDGSMSSVLDAYSAAKELRDSGVRLVVALVSEEIRGVTRYKLEKHACKIASKPCHDNLLIFSSWANVEAEARQLLVGVCPVLVGSDII